MRLITILKSMIKKLSVIGGSGFIGSHLCKQLENLNIDFEIVDIEKSNDYPQKTIIADIRNLNSLRQSINGDVVIHLAAVHTDDIKDKSVYFETNVEGTRNILKVCDEKKIRSVIFTSSVAVYGFTHDNANETSQTKPFNFYGESKLEAEKLFANWYKNNNLNKNLLIIRPTVIFGENNRGNLFKLMQSIYLKKFIMIGSGNNIKSIGYVKNLVDFIIYSLDMKNFSLFNYVDKPDLTVFELIKTITLHFNYKFRPFFKIPYFVAFAILSLLEPIANVMRLKLPISLIRLKKFCLTTQFSSKYISTTGFLPKFTLNEGLKKTIEHEFNEKKG